MLASTRGAGSSAAMQRPNGTVGQNKVCQFKLVLLGESAVGKSSLVLRFVKGQFHEYQESTIGGKDELHIMVNSIIPRMLFICTPVNPVMHYIYSHKTKL